MVRTLSINPYHVFITFRNGRKIQVDKVIEEVEELCTAIHDKDIDCITEELADVELVLPYLKWVYGLKVNLDIKFGGKGYNFVKVSQLLIKLIEMRKNAEETFELNRCLEYTLRMICYSIFNLYQEYKINSDDIDKIKSYKKKRTIKSVV